MDFEPSLHDEFPCVGVAATQAAAAAEVALEPRLADVDALDCLHMTKVPLQTDSFAARCLMPASGSLPPEPTAAAVPPIRIALRRPLERDRKSDGPPGHRQTYSLLLYNAVTFITGFVLAALCAQSFRPS